jgi:hypothetical protein
VNPWFIDPVWTAFSSFHCEMRLAKSSKNDFIRNHHRVAALYFAITAAEAQMNEIIRLDCVKSGLDEEKIRKELRQLKTESRFAEFKRLTSITGNSVLWQGPLKNANDVRNDLTHRKDRGYKTYDNLD